MEQPFLALSAMHVPVDQGKWTLHPEVFQSILPTLGNPRHGSSGIPPQQEGTEVCSKSVEPTGGCTDGTVGPVLSNLCLFFPSSYPLAFCAERG